MTRSLFLNLAVDNLDKSVEFFTKLGFEFNQEFTDETATCMVLSDTAFIMLLVRDRFASFTKKPVVDSTAQTEAIVCVSADSREEVDQLIATALEAGATPSNDPMDMGFMYSGSFQDLDGHLWEVVWMDSSEVKN